MRPDDGTLAEQTELFEFVRSRNKSLVHIALAVVAAIGLAVVLINFGAIEDWFMQAEGRRSGLRALAAPALVVMLAVGVGSSLWTAATGGVWRLRDGRALKSNQYPFTNDPNDLYRRLAGGDPNAYLPIHVNARSNNLLRTYRPADESIVYMTIRSGKGRKANHWPLLTLQGQAADTWSGIKNVSKPHRPDEVGR